MWSEMYAQPPLPGRKRTVLMVEMASGSMDQPRVSKTLKLPLDDADQAGGWVPHRQCWMRGMTVRWKPRMQVVMVLLQLTARRPR